MAGSRPDPSLRRSMRSAPPRFSAVAALGLALGLLAAAGGCSDPADSAAVETLVPAPGARALEVLDPQFPDAPHEIELPHLAYGETVRRTVRLRNVSGAPLTVRSVRPGCSCTTPVLSYVDPATGQAVRRDARGSGDVITVPAEVEFEMELAVDSTIAPAKNQHKLVVVRMTTDSQVEPYVTFNLRVFVESHFLPSPALLDLREISMHGGGAGKLTFIAETSEGRRITEVLSSPRDLMVGLTERLESGVPHWELNVQVLPPVAPGPRQWNVELSTSGPLGEGVGTPLSVSVRAQGVPDIAVEPAIVLLDPTPVGQAAANQARLITRLAGQRLLLRGARVEGDLAGRFEVEATPHNPDDDGRSALWTLRLVASAELGDAPLGGRLVVEIDDSDQPRVEARLHYRP
jgi:hypothetical protein